MFERTLPRATKGRAPALALVGTMLVAANTPALVAIPTAEAAAPHAGGLDPVEFTLDFGKHPLPGGTLTVMYEVPLDAKQAANLGHPLTEHQSPKYGPAMIKELPLATAHLTGARDQTFRVAIPSSLRRVAQQGTVQFDFHAEDTNTTMDTGQPVQVEPVAAGQSIARLDHGTLVQTNHPHQWFTMKKAPAPSTPPRPTPTTTGTTTTPPSPTTTQPPSTPTPAPTPGPTCPSKTPAPGTLSVPLPSAPLPASASLCAGVTTMAPLPGSSTSLQVLLNEASGSAAAVTLPDARRAAKSRPNDNTRPPTCTDTAMPKDDKTLPVRIGQLQVANVPGMSGTFSHQTTADSTIDYGVSAQETHGYGVDGTYLIKNSIGAHSTAPGGPGFNDYVYAHMNRRTWLSACTGGGSPSTRDYTTKFVNDNADTYSESGKRAQPGWPTSSCRRHGADGFAELRPGDTWGADHSHAKTYSRGAQLFDLSVNAQTGYTSTIDVSYRNGNRRTTTWICSGASGHAPTDAPYLWNTP